MLGNNEWQVDWTPHEHNIVLQIITDCPDFRAISRYTITPQDSHAVTYRVHGPAGAHCQIVGEILRSEDGDPSREMVGESASLTVDD